jgi:hypothetical protein
MTLRELQKRINDVVAENDRHAQHAAAAGLVAENRNDLPVAVQLGRYGKLRANGRRRYNKRYVTLDGLSSGLMGLGDGLQVMTLLADETTQLWPKPKQLAGGAQ